MELVFHVIWISFAADVLCASFIWSWYYRSAIPVIRVRKRCSERSGTFPTAEALQRRGRGLLFRDLGNGVYGFRRGYRQGPSLLLGLVTFHADVGEFQVQGRVGLFVLSLLASVGVLALRWPPPPFAIVAITGIVALFIVNDLRLVRKVAKLVASI